MLLSYLIFYNKIKTVAKLTQLSLETYTGIYVGVVGIEIARSLERQGEIEESVKILQALIDLFEKLLSSLQDGLSENSEWLAGIDRALNSVNLGAIKMVRPQSAA